MSETFTYDVFLSHSSKDKEVVVALAERLRTDGLRVWFPDWEIKPGDDIRGKIEEGLERSRVLVLCMSANAFSFDWQQLETDTFRFRDPLNLERRFIPLRLDDAPSKGALAQFLFIDWRAEKREQEYAKLRDACRRPSRLAPLNEVQQRLHAAVLSPGHTSSVNSVALSQDGRLALSGSDDKTVRLWEVESGRCLHVYEGHAARILSVTFNRDGLLALSGSYDNTVRLWEVESGHCLRVFKGHTASVMNVAFNHDGSRALSGSYDNTVRLWDAETGRCLRVFEGHTASVLSVVLRQDGSQALTGSSDNTVRLWDVEYGNCLRIFAGHTVSVNSVALNQDSSLALSGSTDNTLRLWEVESGRCLRVLKGHTARVWSVALSQDGSRALSGSDDKTVRLWEVESGRCLRVLNGHTASVRSVALSQDGSRALSVSYDKTVRLWEVGSGRCLRVLGGHTARVWSVALNQDESLALSGSEDKTVRLWEVESGRCLHVYEGHTSSVLNVALSHDGRRAISGSTDTTVRIWEVESGRCLHVFKGHTSLVFSVSLCHDGSRALSGSADNTVRLWEVESGRCLHVLKGHTGSIRSVTLSYDGSLALTGSDDKTVRLWEVESGRCGRVLGGHISWINSVALSYDGSLAISGSADKTVRLWEVKSGHCLHVLKGHTNRVNSVVLSHDSSRALSGSSDNTVRLWDVESGLCLCVFEGHIDRVLSVALSQDGRLSFSWAVNGVMLVWPNRGGTSKSVFGPESAVTLAAEEEQVQYTNAKVLLVGDTSVGKTGLSMRLALNRWEASDSTVGAWATQWKLPVSSTDGVEREIWLWDFGGQADQRLIHQLYMDETALAVLVFDGQKEDLFETLGQWDRDLSRASRNPFTKLLVAGRVDVGALRLSRSHIKAFAKSRGYSRFLETSAKVNIRCEELKQAIIDGINWENIPWRSSPLLFKRLKDEIIYLKDEGRVLMRFNELRDALRLRLTGDYGQFKEEELKAVIGLLAGPGVVWELPFGSWVLLQPERINAYAQAVIQKLRQDPHERGCIQEERVLAGDLAYHSSMPRLQGEEERLVLLTMHQTLIARDLCLREHTDKGTMLIFPSYYRRERTELVGHPAVLVSYHFKGFLDAIYATLVVRLHHTQAFQQDQLWRYAADFKTLTGKQLGVKLTRGAEGAGELEVYFDPTIPIQEKIIFSRYVHEHLLFKAQDVERYRHYICPHCGTPAGNQEVAMKKLREGKKDIPCINCDEPDKRIPLWDQLEELFASEAMKIRVRELQEKSAIVLDTESKERTLVGEVISTVSLAGQLCREFTVSDHGIDMEIEFKDDINEATGQKLYLQLKSGDSHLYGRKSDSVEIFQIKDERHARYWMDQQFPVLLVIRTSEGEVRWMEVRDWLKRESDNGKKPVKQIIFKGERFDVMSVRRWRDRVLNAAGGAGNKA